MEIDKIDTVEAGDADASLQYQDPVHEPRDFLFHELSNYEDSPLIEVPVDALASAHDSPSDESADSTLDSRMLESLQEAVRTPALSIQALVESTRSQNNAPSQVLAKLAERVAPAVLSLGTLVDECAQMCAAETQSADGMPTIDDRACALHADSPLDNLAHHLQQNIEV